MSLNLRWVGEADLDRVAEDQLERREYEPLRARREFAVLPVLAPECREPDEHRLRVNISNLAPRKPYINSTRGPGA